MRLPKTSLIAIPVAVLAFAGCGGGDEDSTESTVATETAAALSKSELIAQGDAICAEVNAAIGSVAGSGAEAPNQIIQVADLYTGMVDSIDALGAPEEDAGYGEFIAAAEGLSRVEAEVKLAAEREDAAAIAAAESEAAPAIEEFEEQAERYGFEDCSEEPTVPTAAGAASDAAPVEEEAEGGVEVAPEEVEEEEAPVEEEEAAPEEVAPETGGAGGGVEEAAPESGGGESGGGSSGGVGPG